MVAKGDAPYPFADNDTTQKTPGIYMPGAQFMVRIVLGVLAAIYFFCLPRPRLFLTDLQLAVVVSCFVGFHIVWWWLYLVRGPTLTRIRLACGVDMVTAFFAMMVDPFPVPPTGLFVLIAALGNGIQHGLRIFLEQLLILLVMLVPAFFIRQYMLIGAFPYSLVFTFLFMAICIFYAYVLMQRIEFLKNEAETMAQLDPLTRLYNRNAFARTANHMLSLQERNRLSMVLMFADLDNFKAMNDTFGHAFGDAVLIAFADATRQLLRKSDVVARYGGDEFVFLMIDMTVEEAEHVARRLQYEFGRWASAHQGADVGVSFGIGGVPASIDSLDALLKYVDVALYKAKAKQTGNEIVVASPEYL